MPVKPRTLRRLFNVAAVSLLLLLLVRPAFAWEPQPAVSAVGSAWVLFAAFLVFFMTDYRLTQGGYYVK